MLQVKVDRLTTEKFYANYRGKAVPLQYNDQNCTMQQPQRKAQKIREIKTETELLNFNLTLIFEDSDSGSDTSTVDFDQQY